LPNAEFEKVAARVAEERQRQDEKFGSQRELSPLLLNAILGEEVGEVTKEVLDMGPNREYSVNRLAEYDRVGPPVTRLAEMQAELVQVAAVCFLWLEAMEAPSDA
jgi:hypothetical protein